MSSITPKLWILGFKPARDVNNPSSFCNTTYSTSPTREELGCTSFSPLEYTIRVGRQPGHHLHCKVKGKQIYTLSFSRSDHAFIGYQAQTIYNQPVFRTQVMLCSRIQPTNARQLKTHYVHVHTKEPNSANFVFVPASHARYTSCHQLPSLFKKS